MLFVENIKRYYRVGNFLHIVALFALLITLYSIYQIWWPGSDSGNSSYYIWLSILIVFGCMCILAELDGYSRFQNYKQLKDQIYLNGYQERLLKPLLKSSCHREAAVVACTELGIGELGKNFFLNRGYRWYHIIPDFVFQYPLFFFSNFFWRTTFFTPYYRSQVDFKELDLSTIDLIKKGTQLGFAS